MTTMLAGTDNVLESAAVAGQVLRAAAPTSISFTVPGEATPWARAGGGKGTPRFTPRPQREYAGAIKLFAARALEGRPPLSGPLELSVLAVYLWPASWSARRRRDPTARWKITRPDIDNACIKLVCDALNTVTWGDDAQVAAAHAWKQYGDTPRLSVTISMMGAA